MKRALLLALALLMLGSCRTPAPLGPGQWLSADDPRPAALMERLEQLRRDRHAMRGEARFAIDAPDLRLRRPQRIAAATPAMLRVEVLGLVGQVAAVLATDGEFFWFAETGGGRAQQGLVYDNVLWDSARIALTPSQVVPLLLGLPPALEAPRMVEARELADGGVRVAHRAAPGGVLQWLEFGPLGELRQVEQRDASGAVQWIARFAAYSAPESGASLPRAIELEFPARDARVRMAFSVAELVDALPRELFVLQVRPGGG